MRIRCFLSVVDITWDGSGWLKGNVGQTGFYRINYMQQQWEQLSNQLDTDHQVGLMKMTPDFVLIGLTNLTALFSYHLYFFNMFRMVWFTKCFCCFYFHLYISPSLYYFCIYLWEFSVFFYNSLTIFGWSLSLSLEYIHQMIVSKVGHFLIIIIIKCKSGKSRAAAKETR